MMIHREHLVYALIVIMIVSVGTAMTIMTADVFGSKKSPYDSGYDHGCDDAKIPDPSDRYYNQPEKGYSYHTPAFNEGYYNGFQDCSVDYDIPTTGQSQAQSSNNENNNALSQSQATTIYICKENGCVAQ